jgi:hypothetical protein
VPELPVPEPVLLELVLPEPVVPVLVPELVQVDRAQTPRLT